MMFKSGFFCIFIHAALFGIVTCTSINDLNRNTLNGHQKQIPSRIWEFDRTKLIGDFHDYFFFSEKDKQRQKILAQAIEAGYLHEILPETRFYLNKNGYPLGYRVAKTFALYPSLSIEKHLLKAKKDKEYTDSQAVQNLIIRLKRVTEKTGFCFVNLSVDKIAMFENRCYLIDLDCMIKITEFKKFPNRKQWKYLKELCSYEELDQMAEVD